MLRIMLICYSFDVSLSMTCPKVHKRKNINSIVKKTKRLQQDILFELLDDITSAL